MVAPRQVTWQRKIRTMQGRNFEAKMMIYFPQSLIVAGITLSFILGYISPTFLYGFLLSTVIFMSNFALQLTKIEEDEYQVKEPTEGLTFYLHRDCVEVRTQDGRAYMWAPGKDGLNYMANGTLSSGISQTRDGRAYIEFWNGDLSYYFDSVNPWVTSVDIRDKWVKDFQEVK